eukprot:TRINITY_DN11517_c0_g4_i1.p2 TRINITY_DN11517_c0_g4~~TRINITY_DN11517_c0_g4_i1.p2  ORF type:complete len:424 (-),score=105.79 TRINITY_DN11517_c0_g4_i1:35-1306(-)
MPPQLVLRVLQLAVLLAIVGWRDVLAGKFMRKSGKYAKSGKSAAESARDPAMHLLREARAHRAGAAAAANSTGKARLRVAYAIFLTDVNNVAYQDAVSVLAHSIRRAAERSRHQVELCALVPQRFSREAQLALQGAGIHNVMRYPVLMPAEKIKNAAVREAQLKRSSDGSFQFAEEQIKYWGLYMTEYDRVLVLDADSLVLDPMDELMELPEDFVGTYDHGLDVPNSVSPPVQGGFLLFRPSLKDLRRIRHLTGEGDFHFGGKAGWKNSGVGYAYGGTGPDGMLAYFYQRGALSRMEKHGKKELPEILGAAPLKGSRMRAVDRSVYDLVLNQRLKEEVDKQNHDEVLANVKSVHFTGDCPKPWICRDDWAKQFWLCSGLHDRWWQMRADLEASRGLPKTSRQEGCKAGAYKPMTSGAADSPAL